MKKSSLSLIVSPLLLLTGCFESPTPSKPDSKPTVFIKSNTADKFKDITEESAIWNAISPQFVKDKQYLRCDMTEEAMVVFARNDFDIVLDPKQADYTLDMTLISCGNGYKAYKGNRSELPLEERALYKDFMRWVAEEDSEKLPASAKEIAQLIKENNPEGFKRFHDEKYITKYGQEFDYTENWGIIEYQTSAYMKSTKGIVLPSKYYGMSDTDKKILEQFHKKVQEDILKKVNYTQDGLHLIGSGAALSGTGNSGLSSGLMGVGFLLALGGVSVPSPIGEFKITNNRTNKSWQHEVRFTISPQSWNKNIDKPMDDWTYDEIPWSDLD